MRAAVIGIGSNSLRMLVSDIKDAQLHRVLRDREGLRVFAALDENGNIGDDMLAQACASVASMKQKALDMGAEAIHLFATSAVRDAHNQAAFRERLRQCSGLSLEICSGDLEAQLSFMGATGLARSGMIDIGGGSTEIVVGQGDRLEFANSLQMGLCVCFALRPSIRPRRRMPWKARLRKSFAHGKTRFYHWKNPKSGLGLAARLPPARRWRRMCLGWIASAFTGTSSRRRRCEPSWTGWPRCRWWIGWICKACNRNARISSCTGWRFCIAAWQSWVYRPSRFRNTAIWKGI